MRDLDPVLEELTGNKLEPAGPLVNGFLKEIGLSIDAKLARTRMTDLMAPIIVFMPFQISKRYLADDCFVRSMKVRVVIKCY